MSLTIVNGYPCRDCAEIAKAKRGENPDPSPADAARKAGGTAKPGEDKPAAGPVSFGGSASDSGWTAGSRAALAAGVGRRVDVQA